MSTWFARPFSWAILLFALGMTVLLSPVTTDVPREGQLCSSSSCLRLCGPTLLQALGTPRPDAVELDRQSDADCTAGARSRLGYGLLLLLAAAPCAVSGVVRTIRETAAAGAGPPVRTTSH